MARRKASRQLAKVGFLVASLLATCRLTIVVGLVSALAATALVAQAQDLPGDQYISEPRQGESVTTRPRPDFDPRGARAGSFLIFPKLTVTEIYDDNIFYDNTDEVDDTITVISPSVNVKSIFNNHALSLNASADLGRYADEGREDYDDFTLGIQGRFDIRRTTNVFGGVGLQKLHEARDSPDDVNGIRPTKFEIRSANFGYFQRFNRLSMRVQGIFDQFDFDDTRTTLTDVNNDDRDRDDSLASLRFAYQIVPNYEAVFVAAHTHIDYDSRVDRNGFNRDSDSQNFAIGVAINLAGLTTAEFLVGRISQDFDDPQLEDIDDYLYRLEVSWNVTRLTTIQAFAERNVLATTIDGSSSILQSSAGISVDHELRRNLLINLRLWGAEEDFVGIGRTDRVHNAIVDVKWLINPNFFMGMGYAFGNRDSDVPGEEFEKNRVLIQLGGQI